MTEILTGPETLAAAITRAGGPVHLMRNTDFPAFIFPIEPEFTNWHDEERAWRESVALLDLSQHMTRLSIHGRGARDLLGSLAVNSFDRFPVDVAKQMVAVNHDGHVIGDGILFHLDDNRFDLVGQHALIDWVRFSVEQSPLDVSCLLDGNALVRTGDPGLYRYQVQGPRALELIGRVTGSPVPAVPFFHMTSFEIAGRRVRALRHGMAGQPGFELFGDFADADAIRDELLREGEPLGIRAVGARAYSSTPLEAGWIPTPVPAIFEDELCEYRDWLPADRIGSLGGSLCSDRIESYYLTPFELGYKRNVKFDHDFLGRRALERLAGLPHRRKVTLVWHAADLTDALSSHLAPGVPAKFIEFPKARYAYHQYDAVLDGDRHIGISTDAGYLVNDQVFVSLATVDQTYAVPGTEVSILWGEDPLTGKPQVEEHRQVRLRATVAPAPYNEFARRQYRDRH